ncbi:hypothetical protein Tdes44962_MAKER04221 [Teratosphaeria destructans]|uniref:Uncharacterized protein n=1 Tax=Teratosphaeria destructans TaxID=418781 RepID=A0A9W7W0A2_9PEZI|nr:hypothetical protein Tdes44962_MAKER04221 [Teratosphaeria destructans]
MVGDKSKDVPEPTSVAISEDHAAQTTGKAKILTAGTPTGTEKSQMPLAAAQPLVHSSSSRLTHESKSKRDQDAVGMPNEVPAKLGDQSAAQNPTSSVLKSARSTSKRRIAPGDVVGSPKRPMNDLAPLSTDESRLTKRLRAQDGLAPASASRKARKARCRKMASSLSKKPQSTSAQEMEALSAPQEQGKEGTALATEAIPLRRSARNAAKARQNPSHDSSQTTANTAAKTRDKSPSWNELQARGSDEGIIAVTHKRIASEEATEVVPDSANQRPLSRKNAPSIENITTRESHVVTATPAARSASIIPSTGLRIANIQDPVQRKSSVVPRTPAPLPSSPPQRSSLGGNGPKRSTIISFDRTGPRNQGSRLGKTKETSLACASRRQSPSGQQAVLPHARLNGLDEPSSVATHRTAKTAHSMRASPRNVASSVQDALGDFLTGQKTNVPTPTKHAQSNAASKVGKAANQAPPSAKAGDEVFQCIDDFEGSTVVEQLLPSPRNVTSKAEVDRTASQRLMPPPAPRADTIDLQKSPNAPVPVSKDKVRTDIRSLDVGAGKVASPKAGDKRHIQSEDAMPSKRRNMTTVVHNGIANATANTDAVAATDTCSTVPATKQPVCKPTKWLIRKASRRSTKGTVDLGGSPVPKNCEYADGFGTVLEQYSASAKLASDHCHESSSERVAPVARELSQAELSQSDLPPSYQPQERSSNSKHRPASPERDSQAITDFAVQVISPEKLGLQDTGAAPTTDPFKSFGGVVKTKIARHQASPQRIGQKRAYVPCAEKLSGASQQGALEHDPEETLVEPEIAQRRNANISNNKTTASGVPELPNSLDEIGAWRDGLSSHHTNLFDELVTVTHRLVQHLVERETAARDVVEDYRSRGVRLVQQMEMNHAQDFAAYSTDLGQQRKMLHDELGEYSGQLAGSMEVLRRAREQRIERGKGRAEGDRRLLELIAKLQ